jgi:competence protein ComEC
MARLAYRRARGEVLVGASVLVTLAIDPAYAFDPGWQLSIVAAWALAASPREASEKATTALRAMRDFFTESLVASTRVAIAAAPVLAWQFQRVPFTALVANAIAAPLAEGLTLPGVLITGLTGTMSIGAGRLLGRCTAALLDGMFVLPHLALRLPGATAIAPSPTPAQCVLLVGATLAAMRAGWRTRAIWAACVLVSVFVLEVPHRLSAHPHDVLRVTMLDVGQGDSILVDLPDGEAMLVDAGGGFGKFDPGARVVIPWLADMRRRRLAAVVASHPHPDHIGGIPAVLAWGDVAELWDTRQGEANGEGNGSYGVMRAMAVRREVRVRGPESLCGSGREFHGVLLDVLAPCPAVEDGTPPNDASFVLRLRFGEASVLLPGDLERAGEARVLDALGPVTLLKLGHHGSRTSTTDEWLDRLRPRVAIASAGHPSPFGHPHTVVVDRLAARGIPLWTTTERGGVRVTLHRDGSFEVGPAM